VLKLLTGGIYEIPRWDGLRWGDTHKVHDDRFSHSRIITAITSTIWEAEVLVLLMGKINEIIRWDGIRWHDLQSNFHDDQFWHSRIIKVIGSTVSAIAVLVLYYWQEGFINYAVEMASDGMIYNESFIKVSSGVQKLLWGIHIQTHTDTYGQQGDIISLLLFFQYKGSRLQIFSQNWIFLKIIGKAPWTKDAYMDRKYLDWTRYFFLI
jgi:hypothetical protein